MIRPDPGTNGAAPPAAAPPRTTWPALPAAWPTAFTIDAWDPAYGATVDGDDLSESTAATDLAVERAADDWQPITADPRVARPSTVLFVDGVRRIDARVWIDEPTADGSAPTDAVGGLCASYAAGVVCCCPAGAHLLTADVHRGMFTSSGHGHDIRTDAGTYRLVVTPRRAGVPDAQTQSLGLQARLAEVEADAAARASTALADHADGPADLLVVDGPLRGRAHLPRSIGYIKTHRSEYLPPPQHAVVASLRADQRTPVFAMGTTWQRYSWYLRLPGRPGAPWAGVVRVECAADLAAAEAVQLAYLSQVTLGRFASAEYKDARAPQNLHPIAGLERELRRRLGHPGLLYRSLRRASIR